jgi:hypothetical protein
LSLAQHVPGVLRHLRRLTQSFVQEEQRIAYLHVYARPLAPGRDPPLEFITAQESGFEGIACVDDAARAVLLALHTHALLAVQPQEQERAAVALGLAQDWLRFVTYMQEPDGRFLNFIADAAGTKNRQVQAVAQAARLFARLDYVWACQETVRTLIVPVVAGGFYHVYPHQRDGQCAYSYHVYPHQRDGQCAYSVSTLVLGLEELYRASGRSADRALALECADWLAGHNAARTVLYDPETGCCSDGLVGGRASSNCGAESAIEAGFVELARRRLQRGAHARPAVHAALGGGQDRCNRRIV